jgi:hypothetical protein
VNVRSKPVLARTDDSLRLERTAVIVFVEDRRVRWQSKGRIGDGLSSCEDISFVHITINGSLKG